MVTSGHLIKPFMVPHPTREDYVTTQIRVRFAFDPSKWYKASLVFLGTGYIDVALLHVEHAPEFEDNLHPILGGLEDTDTLHYETGTHVIAVGHALYRPNQQMGCSVTSGVLSQVVRSEGQALMLCTDAQLHSGASGGALVRAQDGRFLGLLTQNARQADGSVLATLNCSIPASLLAPIRSYLECKHLDALAPLNEKHAGRSDLWQLTPQWGADPPAHSSSFHQFLQQSLQSKL